MQERSDKADQQRGDANARINRANESREENTRALEALVAAQRETNALLKELLQKLPK